MTTHGETVENLVIGGGLAGSMVALRLAAAGCSVTLLEKERAPHHKVCGEFLSREAIDYLREAGVDPSALGAATIRFVRLSSKRTTVEVALPFTALSLSRFVVDQALLARAEEAGCTVHRGLCVEGLASANNLWSAQLRDGPPLLARTVFLANGKRDLRGWNRTPGVQDDLVAFKLHWRLSPAQTEALRDFIELFLFPGGYGGLTLVEEDIANLCFVVRQGRLRTAGGFAPLFDSILKDNQLLGRRMLGATALWDCPLALSSIPYGYLSSRPANLWCIGDQAAVIPSFTGDGMSIALHSAVLAADMYLAGQTPGDFSRTLRNQLRRSMSLATWSSRAIVSGAGRVFAPAALSMFPGAIQWIAAFTRIPGYARDAVLARSSQRPLDAC